MINSFAPTDTFLVVSIRKDGAKKIFQDNCGICHYPDKSKTKVGPGLKGLFDRESLMVSGRKVSAANVRDQLLDPYENMPSFKEKLTENEIDAIIAYLKTL